MGKPKRKWTDEEVEALRAGVKKHGLGNWKKILNDPILCNRSNVDLKDKSRNLKLTTANPKGEWSSEEKKAILDGVEKHGRKWKKIVGDQEFAATLTGRNNMEVKHKWLELSENQIGPKATGNQAEVSSACGEADGSPTTIGSQNDASSGAKANDGLPNSTGARANGGSPNSNGGQADGSHTASAMAVLFGCGTCEKTAWTLDRISIHRAVDHTETRTCISCSIEFATPQLFHDHVCQKACSFV